ncbi:MAG: 30S ribosomal protein S2 [Azospirillum brasilense]|nr:MAG: 30S ribosomal protein S2 [Azospirillum brasilense]
MSALPTFSMRELIDAGVHFGHKTKRWNPRMAPFIYGARNDVHIIDLQQTVPMLHAALTAVRATVAKNGRILFVGTKRQASDEIAAAAKRCGQYYVNQRWLGGMLTNWSTIQNSIRQLRKYEEVLAEGDQSGLTKKELLQASRNRDKLDRSLGGIRDMGGKPDLLFIIDTNREELAVKEAQKLGIPIVAIIDTNCSVDGIDFPIPGNDDATRAIKLYCQLISDAALSGLKENLKGEDFDFGAQANPKSLRQTDEESLKEGQTPRQQQEEKARTANAKTEKKAPAKAAPAKSTTKKEAFAEEAKKAASKKKADDAPAAEAEEAKPAKKAAKKSA